MDRPIVRQRSRRLSAAAGLMIVSAALTGCTHTYHVGMVSRTPSSMGNVKLYSTDCVPFEYEELGFVLVYADAGPGAWFGPPPQGFVLETFQKEVARTGADAVLNFRIDYISWSDWLLFPPGSGATASGTAVKILRP